LSKDVTLLPNTNLDVIETPTFNSAQFFTEVDGQGRQVITSTNALASFSEGMIVTWTDIDGETVKTSEVTSVSNDGKSFVLDNPLPQGVLAVEASENPIISDNVIKVQDAASKFSIGQTVFVPGQDGIVFTGTVEEIDADGETMTITPSVSGEKISDYFVPASGLPLQTSSAAVSFDGSSIKVKFNVASQAEATALFVGRDIDGPAFDDGTRIVSATRNGDGTVTIGLNKSVSDPSAPIDYFKALSPLSVGGSMNDLTPFSNSEDGNGGDGVSANWFSTFFDEGEGVDGTNGEPAGDADRGTGFNGGAGGNGSGGHAVNAWLIYDVTAAAFGLKSATLDLKIALLEMADAPVPEPVIGAATALPKPTELVKAIAGLTKSKIDLVFAISDLVLVTTNLAWWAAELGQGLAGLGGAGGDGGEASGGADFFGGGTGGAGGDGGSGALSYIDGGDGGSGGRGGDGGFGAGGGMGGAGGDAGDNGNAAGGDPGDGGFAGFGAGEGANGNGMFGGGGSGLGGAIFVREGGRLNITGNSVFELNYVAGGTTTSPSGEAGFGAGTDLFMMKGAQVTLAPGFGNEIRFEGDIADDSYATDDGFMNAAGDGADMIIAGGDGVKGAGGIVVFNGENTYSGNTILQGATLTAEMGAGINDSSLLRFNGAGVSSFGAAGTLSLSLGTVGTFLVQDDYVRRAGMDPFETAWTGSGGFASGMAGEATVTLGQLDGVSESGQLLRWGFDGFFVPSPTNGAGSNGTLTFGSERSTSSVRFTNNVDLNGFGLTKNSGMGRVAVYRNTLQGNTVFETSNATLSGNWTNGGLMVGDGRANTPYDGTLFMTGQNALANLLIANGRLSTFGGSGVAGKLMGTGGDIVVNVGSALDTFGTESANSARVLRDQDAGVWTIAGSTTISRSVVNNGVIVLLGAQEDTHIADSANYFTSTVAPAFGFGYVGDFAGWNGSLNVGTSITNEDGAIISQYGVVNVGENVANFGSWVASGSLAVGSVGTNAGDLFNSGSIVFDAGDTGVVSVARDIGNSGQWTHSGRMTVGRDLTNEVIAASAGVFNVNGTLSVARNFVNFDSARASIGGEATIGGDITNQANARMTQAATVTVAGHVTNDGWWNTQANSAIAANSLSGNGRFLLASLDVVDGNEISEARRLDISLTENSVFGGTFEGAGDLVKKGPAVLTLGADQFFSGKLTVENGGIVANATMNDDLDIVVASGATYTANAADTVNTVVNAGTMTLNAAFRTVGAFDNLSQNTLHLHQNLSTQDGSLDNPGRMVVYGQRTIALGTGADGVVGTTPAGTNDDVAAGLKGASTGVIEIANGSGLTVIQQGDSIYSGVVNVVTDNDPAASFRKAGTGALTLQGAVEVLDIAIAEGKLVLDGAFLLKPAAKVFVADVGTLTLLRGDQSIDRLTGSGLVELGANRLRIEQGGEFNGDIVGTGTVDVREGDFKVNGVLNSDDAVFQVQSTSTTEVTSTAELNVGTLEVLGTMVLQGDSNQMARVTGETASITGMLKGTGMLSAATRVHDGGRLSPGASPGHLHFADLTLASGSTTTMELYEGVDDQFTVNAGGKLRIEGTSALELASSYTLPKAEITRIFNFDTGAVQGFFGSAASAPSEEVPATTPSNQLVLNLATGSVVGLGNNTLGQLKALPINDNQHNMLTGMLVNEAGGVAQFYGGRFIENLTTTWAANGNLDAVFERASPEVYAGLGTMAQSAALNSVTKWGHSFAGGLSAEGSFVDISATDFSADDDSGMQMAYGIRTTNATVGYSRALTENTSLVFNIGTVSNRLEGDYTVGDGQGMTIGLAMVGHVPGTEHLYWNSGVRHAGISVDGSRIANNGSVSFDDVDSFATQFNIGLEYYQTSETQSLGIRGNLVLGTSKSSAFDETAGAGNPLDAMSVNQVNTDYARFEAGMKVGADVTQRARVFGTLDASMPIADDAYAVGATYDNGQAAFDVNARGLDAASFAASIGVDRDVSENGRVSISVGANNDWRGESAANASISARIDF
jgi:fibronectin-binding autotransporter adhesin